MINKPNKMKFKLLLIFIGFSLLANAQQKKFQIEGEVKSVEENKYAYLFIFNTVGTEAIIKTPILNNRFTFKDEISYNGLLSKSGAIFLRKDTLAVMPDTYKSMNCRMLMVDSLSIVIENQQNIKYAKVDGGLLNKEFDEMIKAIESEEYLKFFNLHQNSIISIKMLNVLIAIDHMLGFGYTEYRRIFSTLSNRIQQSIEGKKVAAKLSF